MSTPQPLQPLPTVSIAEGIGLITLSYLVSITAFNAGYFLELKGRFVELFSATDLVSINIPILQYFLSVYSTYMFIVIVMALFTNLDKMPSDMTKIDAMIIRLFESGQRGLRWVIVALLVAGVITFIVSKSFSANFTIEMAPTIVLQLASFYFLWTLYRRGKIALKHLSSGFVVGALFFSYLSGQAWAKHAIIDLNARQAFQMSDGQCLERILLRTNSAGYLLYSTDLRQLEFRNKDQVKTIFDRRGCL
jgi:hypothetical protein